MEVLGGSCFTYQQLLSTSTAILAATGCGHKEEEARLLLCWINAHISEHLQSCLVGVTTIWPVTGPLHLSGT